MLLSDGVVGWLGLVRQQICHRTCPRSQDSFPEFSFPKEIGPFDPQKGPAQLDQRLLAPSLFKEHSISGLIVEIFDVAVKLERGLQLPPRKVQPIIAQTTGNTYLLFRQWYP